MLPLQQKKSTGATKLVAGAILDPAKRAVISEAPYNAFEVDFTDPELLETPEVIQIIDIIYFDRKSELLQLLRKCPTPQLRLFLQTPFMRKVGGKHPLNYWWKASHYAARYNRMSMIEEFSKKGVDIYSQDGLNRTIMHYSAEYCHVETLKHFAPRASVMLSIQDIFGMTPLMFVCSGNSKKHIELCRSLLALRSDTSIIQRFGYSALMYACKCKLRKK